MYKQILLAFAALFLIQGCASNYKTDTDHSLAWNISKASDVKIKEVPQEKFAKAVGQNYDGDMNKLLDAGLSSGVVDLAWYSSTGILTLADIGTTFGISLLLRMAEPEDPARKEHILAWMPESSAEDEEDAVQKMVRTLVDTLKKLPEPHASLVDWEKTEREINNVEQKFLKSEYQFNVYFTGDECDVFDCKLFMNLFEPELTGRPDFIKNNEDSVYHFKPDGFDIPNILFLCESPNKFFPSGKPLITTTSYDITKCRTRMRKISDIYFTLLPDWFYLYKLPSQGGNPLPYLQHKGDVMLYVKPS